MKFILIGGKSGHGKDYVCDLLLKKLKSMEYRTTGLRYAKPLYQYMTDNYEWDGNKDLNFRKKMQEIGTEHIRYGLGWHDFLARRLLEDATILSRDFDIFVVPDLRFLNEVKDVVERHGEQNTHTLRVVWHDSPQELSGDCARHVSENQLNDYVYDYELVSLEGQLDYISCKLDEFLNTVVFKGE